ncbi:hypothetical protein [Ezakiella coagulans]|uniref:hypothetical protein n=1 Tax=Ezakiella coagulans TaxID=46507 RepID=UPI0020148683|nr:hypothetical protein [Ezakiella coagulans]UQK61248.1 hypothetical protein M1R54_02835 [Ezakiella coagulans]
MKNEMNLEKIPYVKIILFAVLFSLIFTKLFVIIGKEKVIDAKITQVEIENEDLDEIYDKIWKMWDFFGRASGHNSGELEEEKKNYEFYAPTDERLFSEVFMDPEKFYENRKNGTLNNKILFEISMLMEKCTRLRDEKKINVLTFEYKGEEIRFPIGLGITR